MRIDTQSSFWSQVMGRQKAGGLWLTGSMRAADARKAAQQQEFLQKVSALKKDGQAGSAGKKEAVLEEAEISSFSEFLISKEKVPAAIESELERYYHAVGNLVDNLTGMEEQLSYMQAKYDQEMAEGREDRAEMIRDWNEKQYQDMSWMARANLGISHFHIDHAQRLYGEDFCEEAKKWLGDLPDQVKDISQGLQGAGSVKEALGQIAAAKEQLKKLAEDVAGRYQDYSGKEIAPYVYQTAEDFAGISWDSHLIYPGGNLQPGDALAGEAYLKKLDVSQYLQAGKLLDKQG